MAAPYPCCPTADRRPESAGRPRATSGPSISLVGAILLVIVAAAARGTADGQSNREYQTKAAFVHKFVQFAEWPAEAFDSPSAPLVVAVIGQDPFGNALEQAMAGKTVGGRELVVKRFSTPADMAPCHVLIVCRSEDERLEQIFQKLGDASVLTVGETERFPWAGGVIRFLMEDNEIRFEVNVEAAEKARLKISSKLLKLAKLFRKEA